MAWLWHSIGYCVLCRVAFYAVWYKLYYNRVVKLALDKVRKFWYTERLDIPYQTLVRYTTCDIRTHEHTFAYHNFQLYPVKLCQKIYHNLTWYRLVINWHNCPRVVIILNTPFVNLDTWDFYFHFRCWHDCSMCDSIILEG